MRDHLSVVSALVVMQQQLPIPMSAAPLGQARDWIAATLLALLVILILVIPFLERAKGVIGRLLTEDLVNAHNSSEKSHADTRQILAILNNTVASMQRQIDSNERIRRESTEAMARQLQMAIDLLERLRRE